MEPRIKERAVIICKNRINSVDYAQIMRHNAGFCLFDKGAIP